MDWLFDHVSTMRRTNLCIVQYHWRAKQLWMQQFDKRVVHLREGFRSHPFRQSIWHPREIGKVPRGVAPSPARQCGVFSREALGSIGITICYGNGKPPRFAWQLAGQTSVHIQTRLPQNFDRSRNIRLSREHHRTRFRHCSDQRGCTEKMFHANRTVSSLE